MKKWEAKVNVFRYGKWHNTRPYTDYHQFEALTRGLAKEYCKQLPTSMVYYLPNTGYADLRTLKQIK